MKRLISLFLILSLVFSVAACGNKEDTDKDTDVTSSESSTPEDVFDDLQNSDESVSTDPDGFDNTSGTDASTPTPGQSSSTESDTADSTESTVQNTSDSNTGANDTAENSNSASEDSYTSEETAEPEYAPSILLDGENRFYYEGEGYVYGITEGGAEVIGYLEDGEIIDILQGGGQYNVSNGSQMFNYGKVKSFTKTLVDGEMSVSVSYELSGICASSTVVKNTYVFHRNSITVTADLDTTSSTAAVNSGSFNRIYMQDIKETEKLITYDWVYPENGDFPYMDSDGMCIKQWFDDEHVVYFYNRDINQADYYYLPDYPTQYFPITVSKEKGFSYNLVYDIVLENAKTTEDLDYMALFEGADSQFAAGIAPITETNDNSTVFVGDEVELNINVTNLSDADLQFSLRYDVRDYYGNIVDAGIFINSTVFFENEANRNIKISGNYGMYWLNLYIVSPLSTYSECYPFMLTSDYEFEYKDESPFGIDAPHYYNLSERQTNASIMGKIGVARVRTGFNVAQAKELSDYGVRIWITSGRSWTTQKQLDALLDNWNSVKQYADWFVTANEYDGEVKGNLEACLALMKDSFLPEVFNKLSPFVKANNIPTAFVASCHGNLAWQQAMYENGVWQASDIIDTHFYCYPKVPDKYGVTENAMTSVEYGLERMNTAFSKYGGREEKIYSVGETGYPTVPGENKASVDIRTQADFNTRTGILSLAYGVDYVNYYCLLDRTSYYKGTSTEWAEMNFGAFYCYDYYGIVKPKPWAAAYASLTRQLDGVQSVAVNTTYDEDTKGTVRAFTVDNHQNDNMIVAWSNIYMLRNTTSKGVGSGYTRIPNLPWNNQWEQSENVVFTATKDVVTVTDTMGNTKEYKAQNGKVTITLTGSPVYIRGVK